MQLMDVLLCMRISMNVVQVEFQSKKQSILFISF